MSPEAWIALAGVVVAILSGLAAFIGSAAALKVHLGYLRRDVDEARRSARRAHWRLDEINAPPAPSVD